MRKMIVSLIVLLLTRFAIAQDMEVHFVADGKIIQDATKAKELILLKAFNDSCYERKDYKMNGPLFKTQTFMDIHLKILNGPYQEYHKNGQLSVTGQFENGKKEGRWTYYNEKGKYLSRNVYQNDSLIETLPPSPNNDKKYPDEKEAQFIGGISALRDFLIKNLNADIGLHTKNGGKVLVSFTVSTSGKVENRYIFKSVHPLLDEEALRVIGLMPDWEPAFQNGKHVRGYFIQPISFAVE